MLWFLECVGVRMGELPPTSEGQSWILPLERRLQHLQAFHHDSDHSWPVSFSAKAALHLIKKISGDTFSGSYLRSQAFTKWRPPICMGHILATLLYIHSMMVWKVPFGQKLAIVVRILWRATCTLASDIPLVESLHSAVQFSWSPPLKNGTWSGFWRQKLVNIDHHLFKLSRSVLNSKWYGVGAWDKVNFWVWNSLNFTSL